MKHSKGFLFAPLPLIAVLLAGCPLNQTDGKSEGAEEKKTALSIVRAEGVDFTFAPSLPLVEEEGKQDSYILQSNLTNSSFNHHTGEFFFPSADPNQAVSKPIGGDGLVPGNQNLYLFAKGTIESPEGADVYFDAEHSKATPFTDSLMLKALRVAFYSAESAFVYAPLQDAAKCSYIQNTAMAIGQYGDELFDQTSKDKVKLPNKTTTMVVWFDGNDENMVNNNYSKFAGVELMLAFS